MDEEAARTMGRRTQGERSGSLIPRKAARPRATATTTTTTKASMVPPGSPRRPIVSSTTYSPPRSSSSSSSSSSRHVVEDDDDDDDEDDTEEAARAATKAALERGRARELEVRGNFRDSAAAWAQRMEMVDATPLVEVSWRAKDLLLRPSVLFSAKRALAGLREAQCFRDHFDARVSLRTLFESFLGAEENAKALRDEFFRCDAQDAMRLDEADAALCVPWRFHALASLHALLCAMVEIAPETFFRAQLSDLEIQLLRVYRQLGAATAPKPAAIQAAYAQIAKTAFQILYAMRASKHFAETLKDEVLAVRADADATVLGRPTSAPTKAAMRTLVSHVFASNAVEMVGIALKDLPSPTSFGFLERILASNEAVVPAFLRALSLRVLGRWFSWSADLFGLGRALPPAAAEALRRDDASGLAFERAQLRPTRLETPLKTASNALFAQQLYDTDWAECFPDELQARLSEPVHAHLRAHASVDVANFGLLWLKRLVQRMYFVPKKTTTENLAEIETVRRLAMMQTSATADQSLVRAGFQPSERAWSFDDVRNFVFGFLHADVRFVPNGNFPTKPPSLHSVLRTMAPSDPRFGASFTEASDEASDRESSREGTRRFSKAFIRWLLMSSGGGGSSSGDDDRVDAAERALRPRSEGKPYFEEDLKLGFCGCVMWPFVLATLTRRFRWRSSEDALRSALFLSRLLFDLLRTLAQAAAEQLVTLADAAESHVEDADRPTVSVASHVFGFDVMEDPAFKRSGAHDDPKDMNPNLLSRSSLREALATLAGHDDLKAALRAEKAAEVQKKREREAERERAPQTVWLGPRGGGAR